MDHEKYQTDKAMHDLMAERNRHLEAFGDAIATRERYKNLDGMEAIHFYLVNKFAWLPKEVMAMTTEHIRFVLCQELEGWTLPPAARI